MIGMLLLFGAALTLQPPARNVVTGSVRAADDSRLVERRTVDVFLLQQQRQLSYVIRLPQIRPRHRRGRSTNNRELARVVMGAAFAGRVYNRDASGQPTRPWHRRWRELQRYEARWLTNCG